MQSTDIGWRLGAAIVLCAAAAGCASVSEPLNAMKDAVAAVASPGGAAVAGTVAAEPEAGVSPAVQRAFDEARRALRAGRSGEAERAFRALAVSNPELGGPHANLGLIYRRAGKLPQAVAEMEKAVRANPRQPIYLNQLGVAYREQGRFKEAREAYENAIALDPNYAAPQLNLGILYDLYLADGQRALELYERYLGLAGGDATVAKWIADLKNRKPQPVALNRKEKE